MLEYFQHQETDQDKIALLEWVVAVLALKYLENESEATVILSSRALGIFSRYDVTVDVTDVAATVSVKVHR